MSKEQRRSPRIQARLKVHVMRRGVFEPMVAGDINIHGLFIRTPRVADIGELLNLILELPDGPLRACATVRSLDPNGKGYGMGVELFGVNGAEHRRWYRYYRGLVDAAASPEQTSAV